jgi:hypothetical protein
MNVYIWDNGNGDDREVYVVIASSIEDAIARLREKITRWPRRDIMEDVIKQVPPDHVIATTRTESEVLIDG